MTVDEIISGVGDAAIAIATGRTRDAVRKWRLSGIPERHWQAIRELHGGLTVEQLHQANCAVRGDAA